MLQNQLNRLCFYLRNKLFLENALRRSRPALDSMAQREPELAFYREVLTQASPHLRPARSVWDVGCRNWSYAQALAQAFPHAKLRGVEVDGARLFWNLYRRRDLTEAYVQELRAEGRDVECYFTDFRKLELEDEPALFCFFFPFVSHAPCLAWGLSLEFADFGALLRHALCSSEAQIFSVHQGEWEAEIARHHFQALGLRFFEKKLSLSGFPHDVHLFVAAPLALR